jgi:CRISPR-associated protein Cas1
VGYSSEALRLQRPDVYELPRVEDRITFLYLDLVRVRQDATGVVADDDSGTTVPIPSAALSVLLLGPGCSITTPAARTLYRSGTTIIYSGENGAVGYAASRPLTGRAKWAEAQARLWANPDHRRSAARTLFQHRFPDLEWPEDAPLNMMRGLEGTQVKKAYRDAARSAGLRNWRRETDPDKADDPVNPLLNLANSVLYGAALAAVSALALSPSLGIVHQGASGALLFDLADLHKTRSSIPIAFRSAKAVDPPRAVRTAMRDYLTRNRVLRSNVLVLTELLEPHLDAVDDDRLLDDSYHAVPGSRNYAP